MRSRGVTKVQRISLARSLLLGLPCVPESPKGKGSPRGFLKQLLEGYRLAASASFGHQSVERLMAGRGEE